MNYKEQTVYNTVKHIIDKRKAAGKFPPCALLSEVRHEVDDYLTTSCSTAADCIGAIENFSRNWYVDVLDALVEAGCLKKRPAQNEPSYYLV